MIYDTNVFYLFLQFLDFFCMDPGPDPDFPGSDPDFWPIWTQEKSSIRIGKKPGSNTLKKKNFFNAPLFLKKGEQ